MHFSLRLLPSVFSSFVSLFTPFLPRPPLLGSRTDFDAHLRVRIDLPVLRLQEHGLDDGNG